MNNRTSKGRMDVKKILIIEDQKGIRLLLEEVFSKEGIITLTAENGFEALNILEKEKIDYLLLDLNMPRMTGIEILEKIKPLEKNIKAYLMTGDNDAEIIERAKELGVKKFFSKPFNVLEVRDTILNC